jgi:archaellum component FlaD/FlaE
LVQEALELDANTSSNEQRKEEGDQEQGDKQENGDEKKELQERDEVEEVCEETTEMNNEQRLHVLAYKKFAGDKITDIDEHICHSSFGDMMPAKQVLLKAVTSLLKKPLLNEVEVCAIELSLSSIFIKINPAIEEILYEQLSNQGPTSTPLELKGISEVTLGKVEEIIC